MGPPPFGDGKPGKLFQDVRAFEASMGPPPFGDGKGEHGADFLGLPIASMGPPPFGDGKAIDGLIATSESHLLQWGHRLSAMESREGAELPAPRGRASMGPPPFGDGKGYSSRRTSSSTRLQWGHRLSAMESGMQDLESPADPRASMGPPPFGDGKRSASASRVSTSPRFNGATAFRRWKGGGRPRRTARYRPLQWGHRLSAMERTDIAQAVNGSTGQASMGPPPFGDGKPWLHPYPVQPVPASMGPPPFGDGKHHSSSSASASASMLQWGHRLSAMES